MGGGFRPLYLVHVVAKSFQSKEHHYNVYLHQNRVFFVFVFVFCLVFFFIVWTKCSWNSRSIFSTVFRKDKRKDRIIRQVRWLFLKNYHSTDDKWSLWIIRNGLFVYPMQTFWYEATKSVLIIKKSLSLLYWWRKRLDVDLTNLYQ